MKYLQSVEWTLTERNWKGKPLHPNKQKKKDGVRHKMSFAPVSI